MAGELEAVVEVVVTVLAVAAVLALELASLAMLLVDTAAAALEPARPRMRPFQSDQSSPRRGC